MTDILAVLAGLLGATGIGTTLYLALRLVEVTREAADNGAALAIARAAQQTLADALKREKERSDAFEKELQVADTELDPGGARDRVLARWRAARTGDGGGAVPQAATANAPGLGDNLIPPGG